MTDPRELQPDQIIRYKGELYKITIVDGLVMDGEYMISAQGVESPHNRIVVMNTEVQTHTHQELEPLSWWEDIST